MLKQKVSFELQGETKEEIKSTAYALSTIYKKVDNEDLIWIANKLKADKKIIKKVKKLASNKLVKNLL